MERISIKFIRDSTGINPQMLKGIAIGLGVEMMRISGIDSISVDDARRIKERHAEYERRVREQSQPIAL